MLIIDSKQRLYMDLKSSGLDIEDFFSHIHSCEPDQFLKMPLEEHKGVIFIDIESITSVPLNDDLLARLKTFTGIVAFMPERPTPKAHESLEKIITITERVIAVHSLPLTPLARAQVRNVLVMFWNQSQERERFKAQMVRFSQEMDELIRSAHQDIHRAKKIHEDVVPKRMEELKGITLYSKYAVGEGAGSEYFDVIKGIQYSHLIFLHTNSYLASSCLMGLLNKFKESKGGLDADLFLQEACLEVKALNAHKKKPIKVELLVMRIEHGSFKCDGHSFGSFELFSRKSGFFSRETVQDLNLDLKEKAHFSFQLERGEKVIVFSPGFIFNWDEKQSGSEREKFIEDNPQLTCPELLMELFFQLKKQSSGDFLAKDATAVMMEVSRHAIQQV